MLWYEDDYDDSHMALPDGIINKCVILYDSWINIGHLLSFDNWFILEVSHFNYHVIPHVKGT